MKDFQIELNFTTWQLIPNWEFKEVPFRWVNWLFITVEWTKG